MKFYGSMNRDWKPRNPNCYFPPRISFVLIDISYPVTCGDGTVVTVHTWYSGETAKKARDKWLRLRPDINPEEASHTVITASQKAKVSRFEPVGERVEIPDETLAAFG